MIRRYLAELNKQAKDMFFSAGKRTCRKGRYHGNAQSNRSNKMGAADDTVRKRQQKSSIMVSSTHKDIR